MRIKHRFTFGTNEKDVIRFLDKQRIEYDIDETVTAFELFEDDEKFTLISGFMTAHHAVVISNAVYTHEEIERAQWLAVRSSWLSQYPQPKDSYKFTTYDATDYCEGNLPKYICEKGLVQKECFVLAKEPNWGSRNFMMLNWVWDELFISMKAEEVLKNSGLKGFEIYDVLNKSKKKFDGIKQIFIKTYIDEGLSADSIQKKYICPKCNFTKYLQKTGSLRFYKIVFKDIHSDIVKTTDKFSELSCISLILVTHKFYDVIKKAKLERGLVFEPIELI